MKSIIQRANERGAAEHGWLHSHHSFSFANYYNPKKMGFGLLRVLNDDVVEGGEGFGTHPHNNMEIITIMLDGALEHRDSMDSVMVLKPGDVQVMSAGSGITHSEINHSESEPAKLLQIWIMTKERDIKPRYDQKNFGDFNNGLKTIASGKTNDDALYIHQNASLTLGKLKGGEEANYKMQFNENGVYLFVISGSVHVGEEILNDRDAVGIYDTDEITIKAPYDAYFVLIDVPMN